MIRKKAGIYDIICALSHRGSVEGVVGSGVRWCWDARHATAKLLQAAVNLVDKGGEVGPR